MVASVCALITLCHICRRDRELGGDFEEGMLGVWQPELILEEGGFGGVSIGVGKIRALSRIEQLLRFLHKAREVQHDVDSDRKIKALP